MILNKTEQLKSSKDSLNKEIESNNKEIEGLNSENNTIENLEEKK